VAWPETGGWAVVVSAALLARALFKGFPCFAELRGDIPLEPLWINGVRMQQQGQRLFVAVDALEELLEATGDLLQLEVEWVRNDVLAVVYNASFWEQADVAVGYSLVEHFPTLASSSGVDATVQPREEGATVQFTQDL